jgi:hypothetical protein
MSNAASSVGKCPTTMAHPSHRCWTTHGASRCSSARRRRVGGDVRLGGLNQKGGRARKAKAQELPLPRVSHCAFRLIDLELQSVLPRTA